MFAGKRYLEEDFNKAKKLLSYIRRKPTLAIQENFERQFINMQIMTGFFIGFLGRCCNWKWFYNKTACYICKIWQNIHCLLKVGRNDKIGCLINTYFFIFSIVHSEPGYVELSSNSRIHNAAPLKRILAKLGSGSERLIYHKDFGNYCRQNILSFTAGSELITKLADHVSQGLYISYMLVDCKQLCPWVTYSMKGKALFPS